MEYYKKKYPKIKFINVYIGDTYGTNDNRKKIFPTIIKNYKKNKRTVILTKKLKLNIVHVNDIINGLNELNVLSAKRFRWPFFGALGLT